MRKRTWLATSVLRRRRWAAWSGTRLLHRLLLLYLFLAILDLLIGRHNLPCVELQWARNLTQQIPPTLHTHDLSVDRVRSRG